MILTARARRLRAPLLLTLAALLALEAGGGLVLFFARLAFGTAPGETLHVLGGVGLTLVYVVYQAQHLARVWPIRRRLDYGMGLLASATLVLTNATGIALAFPWWWERRGGASVEYPAALSAWHDVGSMLVLTFVVAHVLAVLMRDRRPPARAAGDPP